MKRISERFSLYFVSPFNIFEPNYIFVQNIDRLYEENIQKV